MKTCSICSRRARGSVVIPKRRGSPILVCRRCIHAEVATDLGRMPAAVRAKITIDADCWVWTGFTTSSGQPGFYSGSKKTGDLRMVSAARVVYQVVAGDLGDRKIGNRCGNRLCVRPDHYGDAVPAMSMVSHCPRGHEYSLTNTYYQGGRRYCRQCMALRQKEKTARTPCKYRIHPNECPRGHTYTEKTTGRTKAGYRRCLECSRLDCAARRRRAAADLVGAGK